MSRRRALVYAAAVLVLLLLGGRLVAGSPGADGGRAVAPEPAALEAEPAAPRKVVVHVVGAVRAPGLYELDDGSRVDDAIARAGGAKARAALELVNLAAPVGDGQQIVVPVRGRAGTAGSSSTAASPGSGTGSASGPVHLNTATVEELDALPGIGPVTAQKIIDYRTENGAFTSVDELDAVPGIGPARLEELRTLVQL